MHKSNHLKNYKRYTYRQDVRAVVSFSSAVHQECLFHNLIVVRKVACLLKLGRQR